MEILTIFLIGISLSMDTFSLSIGYGTLNISKSKIWALTIIVGLFHFFMPQLGMLIGDIIIHYILINVKYLVSLIFFILGITMIINKKEKQLVILSTLGMLLFGFSVSIDSFSAGIGLEFISNKHLLSSLIFSITSAIFTYIGLRLGKKINEIFKDISPILGGILLILFAIFCLLK